MGETNISKSTEVVEIEVGIPSHMHTLCTHLEVEVQGVVNINGLGVSKARVLETVDIHKVAILLGEHGGSATGVLLASLHQEGIVVLHTHPNERIRHYKFLR